MKRAYYGRDGSFRGYKDGNKYYDATGRYKGCYVPSTGKFYGAQCEYKGRSVRMGNVTKFYDAQEKLKGWRDNASGIRYGAHGEYKGRRAQDGKFYGPHGEYLGKSEPRGGSTSRGGGLMGFFRSLFGSR